MLTLFSSIVALAKAIPVVDKWFQQFVTYYVNSAIDRMAVENREAIKKAIEDQDQRDLEKAIGNANAGELSEVPGTVVRDNLPGVKP
jgi:hypothetical protein